MTDYQCAEGLCALTISIVYGCIPEKAFTILYEGKHARWITDDIKAEIKEFRKHKSLNEVADIFFLNQSQISRICHGRN